MEQPTERRTSDQPSGDPTLLNKVAWARRWSDPKASVDFALTARAAALKGSGKRSRMQHGLALCTLAWQSKWRGSLDEAMGFCLSAESYLPERENMEPRARIYAILGGIHFARNRFDLANCALDRGFWLVRDKAEESVQEALVELLLNRAIVQRHTGERARAGITLGRVQELCTPELRPSVDYCTALWLLADGDAEAARIRGVTAVETARGEKNSLIMPYLLALLGGCDVKLKRYAEARDSLMVGMKLAREDGDQRVECFIQRNLALLEMENDNLEQARTHLEDAARTAKALNHSFERKRIALQLAELFERAKDYKKAVHQHNLAWRFQNETRMS
ncbi:MAG: tetratricopeptide repeat protein [Pseudomonadota bacterium]